MLHCKSNQDSAFLAWKRNNLGKPWKCPGKSRKTLHYIWDVLHGLGCEERQWHCCALTCLMRSASFQSLILSLSLSLSPSLAGSGCSSRKRGLSPARPLSLWPIDFLPLCAAQMMASEHSCLRTETFLLLSYSAASAPLPPLLTGTPKCPYVTKDWQAWPRKGIWFRTGALLEKVIMSKTKSKNKDNSF